MKTESLLAFVIACAAACDQGVAKSPTPPTPTPTPPPPTAAAKITLSSVTFADDCGGTPPAAPAHAASPPAEAPAAIAAEAPAKRRPPSAADIGVGDGPGSRICVQTSMQLSITATQATEVHITSVEVLDDKGASLGTLASRSPTRWVAADSAYKAWDEHVAAGENALVSYVLQQPAFVDRYDARDRTYTVKVVASVGGVTQPLQTTVMVVGRPPPVPT